MLILSRPTPGRDAQFNQWYDDIHLREMLQIKGIASARRLRHVRTLGDRDAYPYAAIYEIETEDIDAVLKDIYREASSGRLLIDEALDRQSVYAAVYEEI
jgi:hypothetical protein